MTDDYRDDGFDIIKKSLTTSHLEMPSFDPDPAPFVPEAPPSSTDDDA
nr:hypothetical protein [uncultured Brevundimonas sp.]